jgi:peptide deformylase
VKKIVQYGNPILETSTKKIQFPLSHEDEILIDALIRNLNKKLQSGAGLAAPQLGISKRICVVRRFDLEETRSKNNRVIYEVLINPEIIYASKELSYEWEGCLSVNHGELWAYISRPKHIKVKYYDRSGSEKIVEARDYQSHIFQHEIDHLDGILFLKYVSDPSELYTTEELMKKLD